jgi:D-amino peptidase
MKKYMVRCDIEGVSGVVSYEQAEPGKPEFALGQRLFMSDLLALLAGLNDGGADEIVVYDEHFYGRNIDLDRLPENVTAICGKPHYRPDWAGGLDETFTGLILLGFHSKRGTGELLHHSYEPDIRELRLQGATPSGKIAVSVGEIGIETAIAGDFAVPLVMITADSAGVAEARELAPGTVGVSVKESLGATGGACPSALRTARMIREAARGVVENPPAVTPWKINDPELTVAFNPGPYREAFRRRFATEEDSVTIRKNSVTACWAWYWNLKLELQEVIP